MFTGIIEELGKIRQITNNQILIRCKTVLKDTQSGDSIAVNGVCLTVTDVNTDFFTADISPETMKVTAFSQAKSGDYVNLERAMRADGRFGGHIVSGHVDTCGKILSVNSCENFYNLEVDIAEDYAKYVVKKGSITINGISLTVADIDNNSICCAIIPHTFENTNLKTLKHGDLVNIEADIFAKYIEKFLLSGDNRSRIDYDFLKNNGYF